MASKIVSAVIAGIAGGVALSCFLVALDMVFRLVNEVFGRPNFIDEMTGIGLLLIWFFVIIPGLIAATGALSVRLARSHISDAKNALLTSYAAGLIAVVLALIIHFFISAYFIGPQQFDEISLKYETRYFIESLIGMFTNPGSMARMFVFALFSLVGGALYYLLRMKKQAPAKKP